jgi:hypothetical protein
MIDAYDIVGFEFVRHGAVPDARNHGGHGGAQLNEIFLADRVEEPLTKRNFTEVDTVTGRIRTHTKLKAK